MDIKLKSKEELLEIAKNSICEIELGHLQHSIYMNVRRAVARNTSITTEIANNLSQDPVLNVSYMAVKNYKSTHKRNFSYTHISTCIKCEIDERDLECTICEIKQEFR